MMNEKQIEALKLALEALEHEANIGNDNAYQRERDAIREALMSVPDWAQERSSEEQPAQQQEPVSLEDSLKESKVCCGDYANCHRACTPRGRWEALRLVETAQPSKPWVGLTPEERDYIWNTVGNSDAHGDVDGWSGCDVMDAIEAKLRELNEHREKNA